MFRQTARVSARRCLSTASVRTEYTSLGNGLTVATESNPLAKSATVGLWVGAGSKFENAYNNGVSKVLSQSLIASNKDAALKSGIVLGGSVGKEHLSFFGTTLPNKLDDLVSILGKSFSSGSVSESVFDAEKSKAIAYTEEFEYIPELTVLEHLHATAFQNYSLALPVNGTEDSLNNLQLSDLEDLLKKNVVSSNVVLVGAGNISHSELVEKVSAKLNIAAGVAPEVKPAKFLGSELRFRDDTLPSAYIAIAVDGPSNKSKDYYTGLVASEVFGSFDFFEPASKRSGSRLAGIFAENHLGENYKHFSTSYSDAGLWGFYGETSNVDNVDDFVHFTLKQWNRLSTDLTEAEVLKAKNVLKTKILSKLNSTQAIASNIGTKILSSGRNDSLEAIFKGIDEVSVKTITAWAQTALWDKDIAVSGTGQIEGLLDYNRLRNEMSMLRW